MMDRPDYGTDLVMRQVLSRLFALDSAGSPMQQILRFLHSNALAFNNALTLDEIVVGVWGKLLAHEPDQRRRQYFWIRHNLICLRKYLDNFFSSHDDGRRSPITFGIEELRLKHGAARFRLKITGTQLFLCHSSGDKVQVRELRARLVSDGFSPWFDESDLLPGQDWAQEIRTAVRSSSAVLVLLSPSSVSKEGFVQKEIRLALDIADEKPDGTIYIVPVRLQECTVPERLKKWHWVDLFLPSGYSQLLNTLQSGLTAKGTGS
jgi:TIR domain